MDIRDLVVIENIGGMLVARLGRYISAWGRSFAFEAISDCVDLFRMINSVPDAAHVNTHTVNEQGEDIEVTAVEIKADVLQLMADRLQGRFHGATLEDSIKTNRVKIELVEREGANSYMLEKDEYELCGGDPTVFVVGDIITFMCKNPDLINMLAEMKSVEEEGGEVQILPYEI